MGKDKLRRFAEMETFQRVFQPQVDYHSPEHELKGCWNEKVFFNTHPIVLELGCGRGEYTVELAKRYPDKNFIGIDIKGARIWREPKPSMTNKSSMQRSYESGWKQLRSSLTELK